MDQEKGERAAEPGVDSALVAAARAAEAQAYSPYSGVRVGAALRATDGRVFTGCNVENVSFGLTLCAERSAVMRAVCDGARDFDRIVVSVNRERPLMPCGACRQVLREFGLELTIVCVGTSGAEISHTLSELLPESIGPETLFPDASR